MPLSLEQFVQQLTDNSLMLVDEIAAFQRAHSPADAEQFARALVKQKKLTAYQAQQAYGGKAKSLILGNYLILDKLGQGGMGLVLKAEHRRMKRTVALKVLSPQLTKTKDVVARFHREMQAVARLEHPNIVAAYDADEANGTHFFVMQYVDGQDLASLVKAKGPLGVDQAVGCILQAARGLEFAHRQGVIHRDIKPANLLLDNQGTVKILDMGLARIEGEAGAQAEITHTGAVMGTVDYMAPEQARNTKAADARSDIYSLGISLWYLLIGRPAYEGTTLTERLLAHQTDPIPSLRAVRAEIPSAVEAVFQRMVAKRPADRYQSMAEVVAALEACLRDDAPAAPTLVNSTSDDSQFNAFLAGLAKTDPGSLAAAGRKSSPQAVAVAEHFGATQAVSQSDASTDPQTLVSLAAESKTRGSQAARLALWKDSRVQIGAGAAVLALVVAVFGLARRPQDVSSTATQNTATESADIGSDSISQKADVKGLNWNETVSPAAQSAMSTIADSSWALQFDGDAVASAGLPMNFSQPFTIEVTTQVNQLPPTQADICLALRGKNAQTILHVTSKGEWAVAGNGGYSYGRTPLQLHKLTRVAMVHTGADMLLFVDGRLVSKLMPDDSLARANASQYATMSLGELGYDGIIDEIRISSVARYSADYTPQSRLSSDADTVALYHMDDGEGARFVDASGRDHTGNIQGATWLRVGADSFAPPLPGDYALEFDGATAWVDVPNLRYDGTHPLTVEATLTITGPHDRTTCWLSSFGVQDTVAGVSAYTTQGSLGFAMSGPQWTRADAPPFAAGTYRVAGTCDGKFVRFFVDGTCVAETAYAGFVPPSATVSNFAIGAERSADGRSLNYYFEGRIDELRVSKQARYLKNYTPEVRLAADADTLALYHFDEGQGKNLTDASGHGHHGRIVGAKWVRADGRIAP